MDLTQFYATLYSSLAMYCSEELDPDLRPISTNQDDLMKEFDFIIVGAGAAGSVVANRLSENPDWTILLIEAGYNEDYISDTPLLHDFLLNTRFDWNYTTVEQKKACRSTNGICPFPRGRGMGGSSTIGGMLYVRGNPRDYNYWQLMQAEGWGYADILPFFAKSENMTIPDLAGSPYHGTKGPLQISYPVYKPDIRDAYIEAGKELGWSHGDYNGKIQNNRIDYAQFTMNGANYPTRDSNSKAFLNPIRKRTNLFFLMNSTVTKILFDGHTATGVQYYRDGAYYSVSVRKEVILSAGAIDSPKLLMLSGIGLYSNLKKHNIDVLQSLPVGQSLQDHPCVQIPFILEHECTETQNFDTNMSIIAYAKNNRGPLTSPGIDITAFFNTENVKYPPNFQISTFHFREADGIVSPQNVVYFVGAHVLPASMGTVTLKSDKWTDDPVIDPNYLNDEYNEDYKVLFAGLKTIFQFMNTSAMAELSPKLYRGVYNNCRQADVDEYLKCMISEYTMSCYNPAGTARMGFQDDSKTVLTSDLLVKNIKNVRVIDASVMPGLPRGNILAPTTMVAEFGSDYIKAQYDPTYAIKLQAHKLAFYDAMYENQH